MRTIQPVTIWKNGQEKQADEMLLRIVFDDMSSSCTFYYQLKEADYEDQNQVTVQGQVLTDGNCSMGGATYTNWDGSNAEAYSFVADQLNIILV